MENKERRRRHHVGDEKSEGESPHRKEVERPESESQAERGEALDNQSRDASNQEHRPSVEEMIAGLKSHALQSVQPEEDFLRTEKEKARAQLDINAQALKEFQEIAPQAQALANQMNELIQQHFAALPDSELKDPIKKRTADLAQMLRSVDQFNLPVVFVDKLTVKRIENKSPPWEKSLEDMVKTNLTLVGAMRQLMVTIENLLTAYSRRVEQLGGRQLLTSGAYMAEQGAPRRTDEPPLQTRTNLSRDGR